MRPRHEIAQIIRLHLPKLRQQKALSTQQIRTLSALAKCRTSDLGGHKAICNSCGQVQFAYNSCRNRHCPKCQATNRERWISQRETELLPVRYFHVVFTLPHHLNALALKHPKIIYNAIFKAAWHTIQTLASDPKYLGAKTAMSAILHSWGQQLWLHPHLHCIVPAGGVTKSGKWKHSKQNGKYLFPQKAMAKIFRAKYVALLREKITIPQNIAKQLFEKEWIVYAKRPFASPKTVVEYLGRYTHKVAISNHRIKELQNDKVIFQYKDYKHANTSKSMTLSGVEFLRRFALHILPHGFVRMRHYGFLASKNKAKELNLAKLFFGMEAWEKTNLSWVELAKEKLGIEPGKCTHCKTGTMEVVQNISPKRGPPIPIQLQPNLNFCHE